MEKKKTLAIAFIAVIILGVTLSFIFLGDKNSNTQDFLSVSLPSEGEVLDFCSTETDCIDFLKSNGMPDNFLNLNNYSITCQNEICKLYH